MLEPIKLVDSEKNRRLSNLLWKEMSKLLQIIIAPDVFFSPFQAFMMPLDFYFKAYRKKSIMLKVKVEMEPLDHNFYLFFEMDSAIVLGCQMRLVSESVIKERLAQQKFDDKDMDAFGEVGNQLVGCLDRLMREFAITNMHLILDFKKSIFPNEKIQKESFENDKEYICLLSDLKVPGFERKKFTILIPQALYEKIIASPIEVVGVKPKFVAFYSHNHALANRMLETVRSRYTRLRPVKELDDIVHELKNPDLACAGIDLGEFAVPLEQKMKIVIKRITNIRGIENTPLFVTMKHPTAPKVSALLAEGLPGVNLKSMEADFYRWMVNFTDDPKPGAKPIDD